MENKLESEIKYSVSVVTETAAISLLRGPSCAQDTSSAGMLFPPTHLHPRRAKLCPSDLSSDVISS